MGRKGDNRVSDFFSNAVALGEPVLIKHLGASPTLAKSVMTEIMKCICHQYGRTTLYVPLVNEFDLTERDRAIYDAYHRRGPSGTAQCTGARLRELAREHDLTERHVRNVIAFIRKRLKAETQKKAASGA